MSIVHIAFYPSDWLAGTRGLTAEETGVYITLIARIYEMAGPIERDDKRLSRLCGCKTVPGFVKALEYLISEGKIIEVDGGLTNERAEKEIENVTGKSAKARAAAESRWSKKASKNKARQGANASPKHMLEPCQSEPEPELEKGDTNVSPKKTASRFDEFWSAYPHRSGKKGRKPSLQKYQRIVASGVSEQTIIDGAIRYQSDRSVIDGYARDPTTWLNQQGWTDEIDLSLRTIHGGANGQRHDAERNRLERIVAAANRYVAAQKG